jgi:hypothetical protein
MIQRFTLDAASFEQVLSALSLVQQLKKQIPRAFVSDLDDGPLSALVEAQQAIETETVHLDAALGRVVCLALQLTPATGAAVWFFTEHDFVCRAATDATAEDEGLRLEVLARLAASDAPDLKERASPARSLLVVPIHQGRNIAGALAVFSSAPNAFSERDGTRVRLLSGLVAHALRKTADAELRQIVSLERAAMLEAMDQIMPALRKLVEDEGKQSSHRSTTVTGTVAELEPAMQLPSAPATLPDFLAEIIPPEPGLKRPSPAGEESAAEERGGAMGDGGGQPNVFLLLQQETEREASEPALAVGSKESVCTAVAAVDPKEAAVALPKTVRIEARLRYEAAKKAFAKSVAGLAIIAGRAGRRGEAWVEAGRWWASRQLEDLGSAVMGAANSMAAHLRSVARRRPQAAVWMRCVLARLSSAIMWVNKTLWQSGAPAAPAVGKPDGSASGQALSAKPGVQEGKAGGRKQKRRGRSARRAAGPALLLLIASAYWILMRSASDPSHATAPGAAPIAGGNRDLRASAVEAETPGTVPVRLSSTPSLTAATFPVAIGAARVTATDRTRAEEEGSTFASSHLRVTDQGAASELASLSRFEIAGLRRQGQYGDDGAAFLLGMAYEIGRGVPQNCVKAQEWVSRSAEAGNAAAQYNLGLRYREGDGVAADPALAAKWLKRAAARKYAAALAK